MKSIGGFLPLETAVGGEPYHRGGVALASGRACWHAILRDRRPARVRLPFYICDAVLQPLVAMGTPFAFYPLDDQFRPAVDVRPRDDELVLLVNYFGLLTDVVDEIVNAGGDRLVVDDTQAFFRRGRTDRFSFNSARKFFGVPDGAYLFGPAVIHEDLPPSDIADCEHLIGRRDGDSERAWSLFQRHEARVGIELRAMSDVSERLLAGVDASAARLTRRENFAAIDRQLGRRNAIALSHESLALDAGPLCYPFLPDRCLDRAALGRRGIFVPTFWPELEQRTDRGFDAERTIARRLLPLPIDHRYGPSEMQVVADTILQVLS